MMPIMQLPSTETPYLAIVTVFQYRGDWWKLEVGLYIRLYHGRHRLDAPEEEQLWEVMFIQ